MIPLPAWAPRVAALAALAVAALAAKSCYDGSVAERALLQHTTDSLRVVLARQAHRADSLEKAFRVDTVRLTQSVIRWRTLRDTLTFSDTVRLTVRESVLVAAADTAIRQCTRTLDTCEAIVAVKDSQITTLQAQVRAERKRRPGWFKRTTRAATWLALGIVAGRVMR